MPIGLSPLHILTLCGPERVLVVSTEPPDDLSCLTTPGVGCPGDRLLPMQLTRGIQMHPPSPCGGLPTPALTCVSGGRKMCLYLRSPLFGTLAKGLPLTEAQNRPQRGVEKRVSPRHTPPNNPHVAGRKTSARKTYFDWFATHFQARTCLRHCPSHSGMVLGALLK